MRGADDAFWEVASRGLRGGTRVLVLERLAYRGGQTRWFLLQDPDDVTTVVRSLGSGSHVALYVNPAIAVEGTASREMRDALAAVLAAVRPNENDVVALSWPHDGPLCGHELPGSDEVAGWLDEHDGEYVLFMHYPMPGESDAEALVPDPDGVVRGGPH